MRYANLNALEQPTVLLKWSWNSNILATWCEEMTHIERLKAGGEGDDRGWDGWMASLTQWTCVWVHSGSWWWTGRPGVLQSMGLSGVFSNITVQKHQFFGAQLLHSPTLTSIHNLDNVGDCGVWKYYRPRSIILILSEIVGTFVISDLQ